MLALQGDGGYPYAVPVNTVIGAGSVVTRFIPGNMLAVGVPGASGNYGSGQDTRSAGRNDRRFSEKPFPFVEKRKIRS